MQDPGPTGESNRSMPPLYSGDPWPRSPDPRQVKRCKLLAELHAQAATSRRNLIHAFDFMVVVSLLMALIFSVLLAVFPSMALPFGLVIAIATMLALLAAVVHHVQENDRFAQDHKAMAVKLAFLHLLLTDRRLEQQCTPGTLDLLSFHVNLSLTEQVPPLPSRLILPHIAPNPNHGPNAGNELSSVPIPSKSALKDHGHSAVLNAPHPNPADKKEQLAQKQREVNEFPPTEPTQREAAPTLYLQGEPAQPYHPSGPIMTLEELNEQELVQREQTRRRHRNQPRSGFLPHLTPHPPGVEDHHTHPPLDYLIHLLAGPYHPEDQSSTPEANHARMVEQAAVNN